jgi:hypothetical protein
MWPKGKPFERYLREEAHRFSRWASTVDMPRWTASLKPKVEELRARLLPIWNGAATLFRATLRELGRLSLPVKILIGAAVLVEFIVITQWERLPFHSASAPPVQTARAPAPLPPQTPTVESTPAAVVEAVPVRNMAPIVIEEPIVGPNGAITTKGEVLFLYGIKQFDSKKVCFKPTGEKWACGLYAYATLRNSIAHKQIICEPKAPLTNGLAATCRMGPTNIATILLRDGLAEVDSGVGDVELLDAQAFAKVRKLGIWDR